MVHLLLTRVSRAALLAAGSMLTFQLACAPNASGQIASGQFASGPGLEGQRRAQEAARAQIQGNLDQALTLYGEALQDTAMSNDRRSVVLSDRGALLARINQPKAAIDDFNQAVQLYPEYPAIYNNRGSTLLTLGLTQEAIKDFDRAILLAPGYVAAYNNRASAYMQLKQHGPAIRDFTKAIELAPTAVAPLNGRGRAMLAVDRPQAAMRDFSRALQNDARFSLGYRNRAEARLMAERTNDALEDLSRAIAFEPTNAAIYIERGQAYLAARNIAAAITDYSKALEIAPRSTPALEARALAHIKLEANDEAEADIIRALEIAPRSATIFAARAVLYMRTDQAELAQKEVDKAARIDPERAEVLWARGEVAEALGRREDAITSYRAALSARPMLREAADGLTRLGVPLESTETVELQGLGVASWNVVRRGSRLLAVSRDHAGIQIPLEMVGEGLPRLLEWEVKKAPHKDIALLRFSAGQLASAGGPEEVEQVAVLDLAARSVLGVVPHRQGPKRANWTWEDNKVQVASVDGITDEIMLRPGGAKDKDSSAPAAVAAATPSPRRSSGDAPRTYAPPSWLPWEGAQSSGPRREARSAPRQKPKTLFDILLGN